MSVAIRYSFANAKQLHMDIYKEMVLTLAAANAGPTPSICDSALTVADAAITCLEREGRIFREDAHITTKRNDHADR